MNLTRVRDKFLLGEVDTVKNPNIPDYTIKHCHLCDFGSLQNNTACVYKIYVLSEANNVLILLWRVMFFTTPVNIFST